MKITVTRSADAHYRQEGGSLTWDKPQKGGGKGGGKKGGSGGKGNTSSPSKPEGWKPRCTLGLECPKLKQKKGCQEFWHPPSHNNPAQAPAASGSSGDGKASGASSSQDSSKAKDKGKDAGKKGRPKAYALIVENPKKSMKTANSVSLNDRIEAVF